MKFVKSNYKFILGIVVGLLITGGVYAATITATSVSYSNSSSGISSTNVQGAIDALYSKAKSTSCSSSLKVGDYVKMTALNYCYDSGSYSGNTTGQQIDLTGLTPWIVIKVNSDKTVELVSKDVSAGDFRFYSSTGYKNYVDVLKRSFNIKSKLISSARVMGYNGQTSSVGAPEGNVCTNNSYSISSSDEAKGCGDKLYYNDVNLVTSVLGTLKANRVGTSTATSYFLSSREYEFINSNYWNYKLRIVNASGNVGSITVTAYGGYYVQYAASAAIRPIITLRAGIIPISGSGTSSSPYEFNDWVG